MAGAAGVERSRETSPAGWVTSTWAPGVYNRQTAIARAINTDTAIRWNQYVYLSQKQATREYLARRDAIPRQGHEILRRDPHSGFRTVPQSADVDNGDALNAALDQLSDPRLHSSALRMAETPISAKMIRDIPFRNAAEAVAFSLTQLKAASEWPAVLLEPRFADERADFEKLCGRDPQGRPGEAARSRPASLTQLREVVTRIKKKLASTPLEDKAENQEALKFVKTVTALTRMLEKPDISQVLAELQKIETTTRGQPPGLHAHLQFAVRPGNDSPAATGLHRALSGARPDPGSHPRRGQAR